MPDIGAPWHYESDGGEFYVLDNTKLTRVCTMERRGLDMTPGDVEARCRLAAQAPNLKRAVRELLELIQWLGPPRGYTQEEFQGFLAITGAKNALKATETKSRGRKKA